MSRRRGCQEVETEDSAPEIVHTEGKWYTSVSGPLDRVLEGRLRFPDIVAIGDGREWTLADPDPMCPEGRTLARFRVYDTASRVWMSAEECAALGQSGGPPYVEMGSGDNGFSQYETLSSTMEESVTRVAAMGRRCTIKATLHYPDGHQGKMVILSLDAWGDVFQTRFDVYVYDPMTNKAVVVDRFSHYGHIHASCMITATTGLLVYATISTPGFSYKLIEMDTEALDAMM
ncbi:hypothetical protein KIPB_009916 [Kipferlia bialata]|uniref:Uncharacterized protein n=1 Tax=Kipferlia bialata TaxID=797122 RepID=A0A9K3D4M3_9EUKA|nr:hypothetical protein KIPB_009916 [Kipferlia bialata]|eukprot:g9916.t1